MAPDKPVILLVHGAFYQPVHYEEVLQNLTEKGYTVAAPALPTTGTNPDLTYADDVEVINDTLHSFLDDGREVIVVAHSSGALPASHCIEGESVAERAECGLKGGIRHYINVCGLAYPRRERNFLGNDDESPLQEYHQVEDGIIHLLDNAKLTLYNDLPSEQIEKIWPTMIKTHSLMNWNSCPKFIDQEMTVPKTYIFCEHDIALPTEYQAYFVGVGGYEDVIRIQSGHSPFLKMPERMLEIISEIAERT
ncbi:methylesterase 6 [Diaporthe amygdali]|uniref:methylesterase 6 n=1 Tax=Phomopsis amygdali TaxID=1214568 RepID=UPI0022FF0BD7|nr:methylesterase 6 [Diaporthe amygdali]KAJ0115102.1 methylesterase 6 [Diaporthe amygdali]